MSPAIVVHVAGGSIGLLSGAVAVGAAKGSTLHRTSGNVFTGAMLVMAAAATVLAITLPDRANLPGGVFSFYLILTAWAAGRTPITGHRPIPVVMPILGILAMGVAWKIAHEAHSSATGEMGGKPLANFVVFALLATFAVALDVRVLLRGSLTYRQRIGRHIWRMCTAMFFATGSFFLGQQKVMPVWVQGSPMLVALALAPLLVMAFWLVRNRRPRLKDAIRLA